MSSPVVQCSFRTLPLPVPECRKLPRRTLQSQAPRPSSIRYIGQCAHRIRIVCTSLHRWVGFQNLLFATILTPVLTRASSIISHHAPHSPEQSVTFGNLTFDELSCIIPTHKKSTVSAHHPHSCIIHCISSSSHPCTVPLALVLVYISPPGSESLLDPVSPHTPPYTHTRRFPEYLPVSL